MNTVHDYRIKVVFLERSRIPSMPTKISREGCRNDNGSAGDSCCRSARRKYDNKKLLGMISFVGLNKFL